MNASRSRRHRAAEVFETKLRVRYAETDQMGVVYHSNYIIWFEVGRVEMLRQLGFTYREMEKQDGTHIAVVDVRCRFKAPALYDDLHHRPHPAAECARSLLHFGYEMVRDDGWHAAGGRRDRTPRGGRRIQANAAAREVSVRKRGSSAEGCSRQTRPDDCGTLEILMQALHINGNNLTLEDVRQVVYERRPVLLQPEARIAVERARAVVDDLVENERVAYAVNTGVGHLADMRISRAGHPQAAGQLLRSHAVGVGEPLAEDVTRAMMLLRANSLAKGFSGVRPVVIDTLCEMLNRGVHPVIPSQGSVGASGDLAPLAHLALG